MAYKIQVLNDNKDVVFEGDIEEYHYFPSNFGASPPSMSIDAINVNIFHTFNNKTPYDYSILGPAAAANSSYPFTPQPTPNVWPPKATPVITAPSMPKSPCNCPIRDLMASGHLKDCPEKKP